MRVDARVRQQGEPNVHNNNNEVIIYTARYRQEFLAHRMCQC